MTELKLGKREYVPSPKDFLAEKYIDFTVLPTPPTRFGFGKLYTDWGMLANGPDNSVEPGFQGAGDCVWAGFDHEEEMWTKIVGNPITFTGANAISDYSAQTGYVLDDPSTDNGTDVRSALGYRQKIGVVDSTNQRHKIGAYVLLQLQTWDHLLKATYIFGAVGMGFQFPDSAWSQLGGLWDVVHGAQIDGGHYVPVVGTMDSTTKATCITWGKRQEFTRAFYEKYNDESWTFIAPDVIRNGQGLHHVDLATLNADLVAL